MEILARDDETKLARCSCGSLHLAFPYATLHFTEAQLLSLSRLVHAGLEIIHSQRGLSLSDPDASNPVDRGPLQ